MPATQVCSRMRRMAMLYLCVEQHSDQHYEASGADPEHPECNPVAPASATATPRTDPADGGCSTEPASTASRSNTTTRRASYRARCGGYFSLRTPCAEVLSNSVDGVFMRLGGRLLIG